jgi:hypothetical protein
MTSRRSKATKAGTKPKRLRALARPTRSRDDFPQSVVDYLADEVGNFCSICHRPTSGPSAEPNKNSNAGTAAHITAASPNGPRHDETISTKQRRSAGNGIWCCRVHGKLIDDDVSTFTVEMLREAKARAIDRARRSLLTGDPDPDGYRKQAHVTRRQIAQSVARAIDQVRWTMPAAAHSWSSWRADNRRSGELLVALDRFRMCIEEVHQARERARRSVAKTRGGARRLRGATLMAARRPMARRTA